MQFTINMPESFGIKRAGVAFNIDVAAIPDTILARIIEHGLTQKIGDAAAGHGPKGSNDPIAAKAAMEKVMTQLRAGEWKRRREGISADPLVRFIRLAFAQALIAAKKADAKDLLAKGGKSVKEDKAEWLDDLFDKQSEAFRAKVESAAQDALDDYNAERERLAANAKRAKDAAAELIADDDELTI